MKILKQLRPFVLLCQLCGLFPFDMELDADTEEFKRFAFSWRRPVTWWFTFLVFATVVFFVVDFRGSVLLYRGEGALNLDVPPVLVLFVFIEQSLFSAMTFLVRVEIALRFSNIQKAFILLQNVHDTLRVDDWPSEHVPRINRRINFGIFVAIVNVRSFQHIFKKEVLSIVFQL